MNDVAVVIAPYNEAESIRGLLDGLRQYRVIVVDDSSPDGTAAIARTFPNVDVHVRPAKMGIMTAYRLGLNLGVMTGARWVVQMDAGGTHRAADVARLVEAAEASGADVAIGSRFVRGKQWRGYRTGISWGAAWLMRRIGVKVNDATSGFRCWRGAFLARLNLDGLKARGFAFQLETLHMAVKAGGRVIEVPVTYRLSNSSFRWGMVVEALRIYGGMVRDEVHTRVPHFQ